MFATGTVLFGGLATAGALPGPVQRATAELGSHVGIDLPGADGSAAGTGDDRVDAGDRVGPRHRPTTTTSRPDTSPVDGHPAPHDGPTRPTTRPPSRVVPTSPTPPDHA